MIVRPFEPKDFEQIKAWASHRGDSYNEDQFPKTGFIVDGFAAYFLYSTDSSVCWLENLISNSKTDPFIRDIALDLVIKAAFQKAEALGFKVAYAATDLFSAARRAKHHGAEVKSNYLLLTKILTPHE